MLLRSLDNMTPYKVLYIGLQRDNKMRPDVFQRWDTGGSGLQYPLLVRLKVDVVVGSPLMHGVFSTCLRLLLFQLMALSNTAGYT